MSGYCEVVDISQNKSNKVKNITKEAFQNQLIRKKGENVVPQITHEEIIKKNLLDNSLRPSDNEICNTVK